MKFFLTAVAALCALPLLSFIETTPVAASPIADSVWYEGKIQTWTIEQDGSITIQLKTDAKTLWFRTPANQASTTPFELLTLHAILALDGAPAGGNTRDLRIRGEGTTERDGDTSDDAMDLIAIGSK